MARGAEQPAFGFLNGGGSDDPQTGSQRWDIERFQATLLRRVNLNGIWCIVGDFGHVWMARGCQEMFDGATGIGMGFDNSSESSEYREFT